MARVEAGQHRLTILEIRCDRDRWLDLVPSSALVDLSLESSSERRSRGGSDKGCALWPFHGCRQGEATAYDLTCPGRLAFWWRVTGPRSDRDRSKGAVVTIVMQALWAAIVRDDEEQERVAPAIN